MKYFSFFSGKGGVGKTTLTIMAASFFAYYKKRKVKVIDMETPDYRIMPFRQLDLAEVMMQGTPLYNYAQRHLMPTPSSYFVIKERGLAMGEYTQNNVKRFVDDLIREKESGEYDIAFLDFPALYADDLPIHLLAEKGCLDGVYVPMGTEQQERRSAYITGLGLASCGVMTKLLWNNVDADIIRRGAPLDKAEAEVSFLKDNQVEYTPFRIKHFRKASQSSDNQCFVRSTICWPDKYVRMWCPELIDLFEEIVCLLQL